MKSIRSFLCAGAGLLLAATSLPAADELVTTAVFSRTYHGYRREKLPDGSFKRERYAISNAGALPGTVRDTSLDKVSFPKLAGMLAEQLGRQNYFLARDSKSADLLLVVHWARTIPFNEVNFKGNVNQAAQSLGALKNLQASGGGAVNMEGVAADSYVADQFEADMLRLMMDNRARRLDDERNAVLLGYMQDVNQVDDIRRDVGFGDAYDDLMTDVEEARYYVIVEAYDFRATVREKRPTLQWITRISIRSPGTNFGDKVAGMLANASRYFGQASGHLVREKEKEGQVTIGESKVVNEAPHAEPPAGEKRK